MRERSTPVPDIDEIVARHTGKNGLCEWCCCEWPCDAVTLADRADIAWAAAERHRIAAAVRALPDDRFQSCGGHGCATERVEDFETVLAIVEETE